MSKKTDGIAPIFKASKFISGLIPSNRLKEILRTAYYKQFYSRAIGKKTISIKGEKFRIVKTLMSIDSVSVMLEYLKYYSPKKGDVIIDAGSFYGIFSLYCSRKIGLAGKVIAFEIDPINLKILKKNLILNRGGKKEGLSNIVLIEKGLWDKKEKSRISIGGSGSAVSNHALVDVQLEKGDDIIKKMKLKKLDLIKMNIEGAEIKALQGLKDTIRKFKPKIIVWANHYYNGEITDKKVKAFLKRMGYNLKVTKDLVVIGEPKR